MTCPACGATSGADARFCASCGRALHTVDERRVVTVLFADLVGFTTLSERLDPERVKNLVDRCFDRLAADITAFGGQVDKIIGDAIVALFGAPVAHEDDAERAVRAALRMQQTLCTEADAIGAELQVRIGVNTGEVLVGAMRAAGSVTAMGDVVNTASRLQAAAAPGEVLVGPATHAATSAAIAYEDRGLIAAKGREEPVEVWRALSPTLPPGYRVRREGVPLIGREHELGLLRHALGSSMANQRASLVLLLGDVGLGKSRLADEAARWAASTHRAVIREGRCVPYGEANAWWPVSEALRDGLGIAEGDDIERARATLRHEVAAAFGEPADPDEVERTSEGLLTLMGYDAPADADPTTLRQEAGGALGRYVQVSTVRRPLVLQLSDLHFADDVVLQLIDDVFEQVHHRPAVILATARPTLLERWSARPGRHNTFVLHLDPLNREATAELLRALTDAPMPPGVVDGLFERSGGNPFFVEELVSLLDSSADGQWRSRDGVASDASPADRMATLPATLRGLVAARLDDLPPAARSVLQDAAVIGQRGSVAGLREMAAKLNRSLDVDDALATLVTDEIMQVDGDHWTFRSDLVREVAYQTITKQDRALRHFGIAHYLEESVASRRPRPAWIPDQLAHHYGSAAALADEVGPVGRAKEIPSDIADRARRWVVEAADRARRDQAIPSAVRLYGQALRLLGSDLGPRAEEALPLLLRRAALHVERWDLAAARSDVDVAMRLSTAIGDHRSTASTLVVRGSIEQKEGDTDAATATLTAAAEAFESLGDHAGRAEALRERAMVEIFAGRVVEAERSATDALAAFDLGGDRAGQGWSLQNLAWIAFVTGRPTEADARAQAAVDVFTAIEDRRGLSWGLGLLSWIRFQQGRVDEAAELGEQVLAEARSRADPWATGMMLLLMASIQLWSGHTAEAVELAGESQRTFERLGDAYGLGLASGVLGRSMVMAGQVESGLELLARAGGADGIGEGLGPASGQVARFARLASAIQLGQPELGDDVVAELQLVAGVGGDDPLVALGLMALQHGDVELATGYLLHDEQTSTDPNLVAARAVLAAITGREDPVALADTVDALQGATYLDRAVAQVAAALAAAGRSARRPDGGRPTDGAGTEVEAGEAAMEARLRLAASLDAVDSTDDVVARAVVLLAGARIATRLGDPDAAEREREADAAVAALGVEATGWRRVFDLALGAVPTGS